MQGADAQHFEQHSLETVERVPKKPRIGTNIVFAAILLQGLSGLLALHFDFMW